MKNPKKLSKLLTKNIMIYHDLEEYNKLEKNSIELIKEMGYPKIIAEKTAKNIKNIYINYDKAQTYYEKKIFNKEKEYYIKSKQLALEINKLLNDDNDCSILVDIVIQWRHKNKINAIWNIFKYWKKNLPLLDSVKATILQIKAGNNHDSRNLTNFQNNFQKIYQILLKNNKLPILF